MLILVRNKNTDEIFSIYRKHKYAFLHLEKFFNSDLKEGEPPVPFNFELIEDPKEIRQILEDKFSSKGRGEEYDEDLPSVTRIAYQLQPVDPYAEKFLIRYWNNTPATEEGAELSYETLTLGSLTHKIFELFILDKTERQRDKILLDKIKVLQQCKKPSKKLEKQINDKIIKDVTRYAEQALVDPEILHKAPDVKRFETEFKELALKALPDFIKNELLYTDLVYSEIYLATDRIQGSIDLCCYRNGQFTIADYKTTRSVDKKSGKPKFKTPSQAYPYYSRQLAIYNYLLNENNMSHVSGDELPNFVIYQIHLTGGTYKKFEIPKQYVKEATKQVQKVLDWYWCTRQGRKYIEPEMSEDEEIDYITL